MIKWLFLSFLLTSCAHSIHQVYASSAKPGTRYDKGKWVSAASEDFVILGFQGDTDFADQAYEALQRKCQGPVTQVTTEFLTSYLFLSYDQKVIVRGFCPRG